MTDKEILDKWERLKDMSKFATTRMRGKIAIWQAELQHLAKERGLKLQ